MILNKGQALIEYLLAIVVICIVLIGSFKLFGGHIRDYVVKIACGIIDQEYISEDEIGQARCADKIISNK